MNDFNRNLVLSLINAKKNINKSLDKWLESAVNEILNNDLTEFCITNLTPIRAIIQVIRETGIILVL